MTEQNPLGRHTGYPDRYAPEVLYPVPREESRRALGIQGSLPFHGIDVWNAYDMSWLGSDGKPVVAIARLRVRADSPNMVESKSLKLYLDSLAMQRFTSMEDVTALVEEDLSRVTQSPVRVSLHTAEAADEAAIVALPGFDLDTLQVGCDTWEIDPGLLNCGQRSVSEVLHSHLLRSNCPVTGQPDIGSILISYHGPLIDHASLLRYLVSYRNHCDFHESCVERIFVDIKKHCVPDKLTVHAMFNRRGGIDINPFRSDFEVERDVVRLWRQ